MSNLYSKAVTCHAAAVADANGTEVDCSGAPAVAFQIAGTVTTATVYFEGTIDGTNYVALRGVNVATGAVATSTTAAGIWMIDCAGLSHCRARLDWTAGSIDVTARVVAAAPSSDLAGGLGALALGKAEDTAHASGDGGMPAWAVRKDTVTALAGTDGDYAPLEVDASGNLHAVVNNAVGSGVYVRAGTSATWTVAGGAIVGPAHPTVDSYTSVKIDLAASTANQVLVAAPAAGKQIWVYGLFMMADTAAGTVVLQDEDDTALSGTMAVSDEGGWVLPMSGNFAMPWIKVATAKALEADTGACTVDGILCYGVVTV